MALKSNSLTRHHLSIHPLIVQHPTNLGPFLQPRLISNSHLELNAASLPSLSHSTMLRVMSISRVSSSNALRRTFSTPPPQIKSSSSGGGGGGSGGIFIAGIAIGAMAIFGVAHHVEHNPTDENMRSTIDKFPGLPAAIDAARGALRTVGQGAKIPTLIENDSAIKNTVKIAEDDAKQRSDAAKEARIAAAAKKDAAAVKAKTDAEASKKANEEAEIAAKIAEELKAKHEAEKMEKKVAAALAVAQAAEKKAEEERAAQDKAAQDAMNAPIPDVIQVTPANQAQGNSYIKLPSVSSENNAIAMATEVTTAPVVDAVLSDLTKQTIALRKELEATLLSDLHELDENALRTRVTQLAAEFFERTKWEGVRVHQSIKQVEGELQRKYSEILKHQREELEHEANKLIMAREQQVIARAYTEAQDQVLSHERHYSATLKKKEMEHKQELGRALAEQALLITDELQDKMNNDIANIRSQQVQSQLAIQSKISALEAELAAFQEATIKMNSLNIDSANVHKYSAAVLNLQAALNNGSPLVNEAAAVAKYADMDALTAVVVDSLPASLLKNGAPSVEELKLRFNVVRQELRKVAMAPEALPPVVGQVIGAALAKIYWQPTGPIPGDGAEEILSRAAHRLESSDLKGALLELGAITDPISSALIVDWKTKVENRLAADQAAKVLRAQAILKHVQFGGGGFGGAGTTN